MDNTDRLEMVRLAASLRREFSRHPGVLAACELLERAAGALAVSAPTVKRDRREYMRDLMRRKRAKAKCAGAATGAAGSLASGGTAV